MCNIDKVVDAIDNEIEFTIEKYEYESIHNINKYIIDYENDLSFGETINKIYQEKKPVRKFLGKISRL